MIPKRHLPAWLPFALLGLALLVLFHRLLTGNALFWGLPSLQFYPWRAFAFDELRAGRLPAWNPYLGAGAPLLANHQTAVFYPPNWLHLLLPDYLAMSIVALAHILWAGLGMWTFTGSLGLDRFGRSVSMLSYALGGYLIARFGSFPTVSAAAWIPWLFWLAQRVLAGRQMRDVGWLALAFGLQLLAGHAQTTWYGGLGLGLYLLWLAGWHLRREPVIRRVTGLALAAAGALWGTALAAIQLVPTVEYLAQSQRSGGLDFETLANLSYNLFRLPTLLSPNFYGTPADGSYITRGIYFEDAAYIGFIPLVAAAAAIWGTLRQRRTLADRPTWATVPFWTLLALLALLLAMGRYGPFFRPLFDYVPTFDFFREPVRWLILFVFSLSILAGIGTGHWGRGRWIVFWSRLSAAGGGAMAVMALVYLEFGQPDNQNLEVLSRGLVALGAGIISAALLTLVKPAAITGTPPGLWRASVLILVTIDLVWAGSGLNPTVTPDFYDARTLPDPPAGRTYWFDEYEYNTTFGPDDKNDEQSDSAAEPVFEGYFDPTNYRRARDQWRDLRAALLPNMTMLDAVHTLNNNDPLLPDTTSRYRDLIEALGTRAGPLLQAAGVTRAYGLTPVGWSTTTQNEVITYADAPDPAPLAWLVSQYTWAATDSAAAALLSDPARWDPVTTVVLMGSQRVLPPLAESPTASVSLIEDSGTRRRYHVTTGAPMILVMAHTWYPGWSAQIDGKDSRLYRANLAFQAVLVPAGESEVVVRYRLNHRWTSLALTLLALATVVSLVAGPRLRRVLNRDGAASP